VGLSGNTSYYVRAYASNSAGTSYGEQISFTTLTFGQRGTVADIDGNNYNTIALGSQIWMAENLRTTKYIDGSLIGTTMPSTLNIIYESTPGYQWVSGDIYSTMETNGRLYTWYAVTNNRNICPTGWHVPTDGEWTTLEIYLITNGYNYNGSLTGNNIAKSLASDFGWSLSSIIGAVGNPDYTEKRNATGFTAFPVNSRLVTGQFGEYGDATFFWSTTSSHSTLATNYAWCRSIYSNYSSLIREDHDKKCGFSVRCVRD
jgi:uncharacterized protein (TIGR02145 family)